MTPPRREINCGHCGATHPTVSEVRACATDNPAASHELPPIELSPNAVSSSAISANTVSPKAPSRKAPSRKAESTKQAPARQSRKRQQAVVTAPVTQPASATPARQVSTVPDVSAPVLRNARLLAGPHALGRSVLVRPDTDVPTEWSDCDEVAASEASDLDVVERLHRAWRERERLVIRWSGPLPDSAVVVNEPFYKLDPGYEIPGERLLFAATANAVNLLDGAPERASFWPLSVAVGLGASVITADGSQNAGDVTLGGTPDDNNEQVTAWIDGGPLDLTLPGRCNALVVPRANWQAGTLTPTTVIAEPTAELADDQLAAVSHKGGSARILAPAGSGKTRVLTERARYLVGAPTSAEVSINRATKGRTGIEPAAVSLVAYNRRAKDEMRERLSDIGRLDIRTLNSMALAIAAGTGPFRRVSPDRTPTTINELDARRILGRLVPGRRRQRLTDPLEPWVDALAACRLGLRDPHEVESAYGGDIVGFPEVLANYRSELAKQNLLDFDEQIVRASERLLAEPAVRSVARAYAPLLLVDEFQDLTPAHLLLIRLIAGPPGDVFAVGDDDQTIYGYAGASPDWLINFDTYFPGSSDYRLTVNYRCLQPVVAAATNLLSYNQRRVTKTINAGSEAKHSNTVGDSLTVYNKGDAQDNLLAHVLQLVKAGAEPSEIAVLSRVHAALLPAAMFLTNSGIPVVGTPGIGLGMLERSGVGAALSWLRLATAPDRGFQAEDLRLALRRPPRSLHPRVADWACEQGSINDLLKLAQRLNTEREANTIAEFASDITNLRKLIERGGDTETLLSTLYTDVGLLGAATQLDTSQRTARRAAHSDELTALMAQRFTQQRDLSGPMLSFTTAGTICTRIDWPPISKKNVAFSTLP